MFKDEMRVLALALVGALLTWSLYTAGLNSPSEISPQGCRMSYMWPSYILQTGLDGKWSKLASRYSLWLYREADLEPDAELLGLPVLFIPGNAGSSRQVRSIASSASRQYFSQRSIAHPYFEENGLKSLDFFAVDFNEDLSAFHGPTLEAQISYSNASINYILSLYPPDTKIIIMGHSMGGIVGTSLLPSDKISAIITMSTPHSVPPARFDSRMDSIYTSALNEIERDPTPIISICGGITDTMIPSEFCVLPNSTSAIDRTAYRRTVFTCALEGCWTGVGHREMVWCHQVRWRVARASLELANSATSDEAGKILDRWLGDGLLPTQQLPVGSLRLKHGSYETLPPDMPLVLKQPQGSHTYLLPIPEETTDNLFAFYLSGGSLPPVSPANPGTLTAHLYTCITVEEELDCQSLSLEQLKLIPNPNREIQFPLPNEGVDESEGVVAAVANADAFRNAKWVAVKIDEAEDRGWALARFQSSAPVVNLSSQISPLVSTTAVPVDPKNWHTKVYIPSWVSNALLVYKIVPKLSSSCKGALLSPMLWHVAGTSEGHYYRLEHQKAAYLHSHSSAPFLPLSGHAFDPLSVGVSLVIHSTGECGVSKLDISIDWWNTFGRLGARYWNAVLAWGAGLIGLAFGWSLYKWDSGAPMNTPDRVLASYLSQLPTASIVACLVALLALPSSMFLGNAGEAIFAMVAAFVLVLSSSLVCLTWITLSSCLFVYGKVSSIIPSPKSSKEAPIGYKRGVVSMLVIAVLVFLVVPWQVAFLACYMLHFHVCATTGVRSSERQQGERDANAQRLHVLLVMTWCLPIVAPVLAVWVRTLLTAGFTTPFDGDHFVMNVLAFMYLTYCMSGGDGLLRRHRFEYIPVPYLYAIGSALSFLLGPRAIYRTYETMNWPTIALVCFRALPKFRS